ncbi:MAG TPA: ABC transporter permease [Steroidobacteraceae bacterium]|nr:ABC transporter permease [Steroidobacteraceae bacterium]
MNTYTQITAVTGMNIRSLPQRLGTSSVIVIGIAGVVAVFVSVLAMSTGIVKTLSNSGRDDRAIVVRTGSSSELTSNLQQAAGLTIADAAGVRRGADGKPLASAEGVRIVNLVRTDGLEANAPIRGITSQGLAMRSEFKLIEGRMFTPGVNELVIGRAAQRIYRDSKVGQVLDVNDATWTIVGVFESGGDSHESELLTDADTSNSAFRRGNSFQSMTVQLDSPEAYETFRNAITTNPSLQVEVKREREFYQAQTKTISNILSIVAYVVGGIMAVGALFGALNALYSAVSTRAREIATLRAIGFGSTAVVVSVFVEALVLALLGGLIGAALAWLVFNGHAVNTSGGGLGGQLVFDLTVTPKLIAIGVVGACSLGLLGGLLPAIRAARLPIATALRAV